MAVVEFVVKTVVVTSVAVVCVSVEPVSTDASDFAQAAISKHKANNNGNSLNFCNVFSP